MTFPIALYLHELDNTPVSIETTWENFIYFITDYVEESPCTIENCVGRECRWKSHSRHADNPMAWSPVEISGKRLASNVKTITLLVLDLDHLQQDISIPWEHVWHTTHNNRDGDHCIRVILTLSRPVVTADWRPFLAAAVRFLGVPADPSCKDSSRLYYRPSFPRGAPHETAHVRGPVLDVDSVLAWAVANPLPEIPPSPPRLLHDEDAWDLDGDAVCLAISTIATHLPPRNRHPLALALAGMLRAHGATMEDARHILHEGFAEGGSKNPEARAKTVEHTWSLDEEAAMTGFTRVGEILGEEAAQEIGDCFTDARNETVRRMLRADPKAPKPVLQASNLLPPAPTTSLADVQKHLLRLRSKKLRSKKSDHIVHGTIINALVTGDDLRPYLAPDSQEVAQINGKPVDRNAAIRIAMGLAAYRLPAKTSFDYVRVLARASLVKMCGDEENVDDLEKLAENAFLSALGRRLKEKKRRFTAMVAADMQGR